MTTDPMDFLRQLYGNLEPESAVIEFRVLNNGGGYADRLFTMNPAEIRSLAARHNANSQVGVYFGVAPRKLGSTRGRKEDVAVIPALWCDVDVIKMGWDMDRTLALIKGHELRPSAVVNSGNGLHLYWSLTSPVVPEPEMVQPIEEIMRQLALVFAGDNTSDISRVLRLPGTWNTKGEKAKLVTVEFADWNTFSLGQLQSAAVRTDQLIDAAEYMSRDEMKKRAAQAKAEAGMTDTAGAFVREAGYQARRLSWDDIWNLAKYGGAPRGTAFIGLDEAILRATALLYAGSQLTDNEIIALVLGKLKGVHTKQRPAEPWDRTREQFERSKINDKLQRFKPRWEAIMKEREEKQRSKRNVKKKQA